MAIKCCVASHHWYEMSLDMKDPHATRKQCSLRRQLPQNPVPISNAHSTKLLQAVFRLDMSLLNTTVIVCLNLQLGTATFVPIIVSPGFESTTAIEAQSLAPKNHTTNNHSVPNQCKQMLIERNLNLIRDRAGMGGSGTGWARC